MPRLEDKQRVRLVLNGLIVTTTVGTIRYGSVSACVDRLLRDFEVERGRRATSGEPMAIGHGSTYSDANGQTHNLQIDLVPSRELDRYVTDHDEVGSTVFVPVFATYVEAITAAGCLTFDYEAVAKLFSEGVTARVAARRLNADLAERRAASPADPLDRDFSMNGDFEPERAEA